jgi:cell surface protein SprA
MNRLINFLLASSIFGLLTSCSDNTWNSSPIDDIESTGNAVDLTSPDAWSLASVPADLLLFPEASLNNDVSYGKNRALLSWYYVDRLFTKRNSSYAPVYIKNDMDALSYPYAREVAISEVFPGHELNYGESPVVQTLILSYYPRERGPYNLDGTNVDQDGYLLYPERRWAGIMRSIEETNLEQSNIEYIQFWLLDPFMDTNLDNKDGGFLYINLGDVSEDILKDGFISHESGLHANGVTTDVTNTAWGKVYSQTPPTYAFDNNESTRLLQDVGLDGLINNDEFEHPSYSNYLNELRAVLSESTFVAMLNDPFSPFNDPAGDNYSYCLSNYYDLKKCSINDRYKRYNGTDGNSLPQNVASDAQYQMGRSTPDSEDINHDNVLSKEERFFQYHVAIHPDSLMVGMNYITDINEAKVHTRNGQIQVATWYQFTIPLHDYQKKVGSIQDFSNIRFIRIYLTGFKATTHLRFATLELAGGE